MPWIRGGLGGGGGCREVGLRASFCHHSSTPNTTGNMCIPQPCTSSLLMVPCCPMPMFCHARSLLGTSSPQAALEEGSAEQLDGDGAMFMVRGWTGRGGGAGLKLGMHYVPPIIMQLMGVVSGAIPGWVSLCGEAALFPGPCECQPCFGWGRNLCRKLQEGAERAGGSGSLWSGFISSWTVDAHMSLLLPIPGESARVHRWSHWHGLKRRPLQSSHRAPVLQHDCGLGRARGEGCPCPHP